MDLIIDIRRHAQSVLNANPDHIGQQPNTPLSELGIEQSNLLGKYLKKKNVQYDQIYSSSYTRALHTAKIVSGYLDNKTIKVSEAIREYDPGSLTGSSRAEIYSDRKFVEDIHNFNMGYLFPNGESLLQVQRRATSWLEEEILYNKDFENKKSRIAIFSHGLTIKCILNYIMGFDRQFIWKINIANTSCCSLRYNNRGWFLDKIGDCTHLE